MTTGVIEAAGAHELHRMLKSPQGGQVADSDTVVCLGDTRWLAASSYTDRGVSS